MPDAPLPAPDSLAPVRYLPAFDNAVLGYDDRSRIIDDADRGLSVRGARVVLIDGRVAGTWTSGGEGADLTVAVTPLRRLTAAGRADVTDEGVRLTTFLSDGGSTREPRTSEP